MSKPLAYIFDIDGTIADGKHRQFFVKHKPKNWDAYNAAMHLDKPIEPVIRTLSYLACQFPVILCSGRQDSHRKITQEWCTKHYVVYKELYMRPTGDYRDDTIIKEEMLRKIQETYDIIAAFDDRVKVVDHYRKLGIFVFDVNQTREDF